MSSRRCDPAAGQSLVAGATMAASSHNTQPWRFEMGENLIRILPDFARRCPVVDPDDHHLYVSLGCAAENIVQMAASAGWHAEVEVRNGGNTVAVDVVLHPADPVPSPLAEAIPHRQCTRTAYEACQVPVDELSLLERAATGNGVRPVLITDRRRLNAVAEWVEQGNTVQLCDPSWRRELTAWIRFNEREARRTRDGLWSRASGQPEIPRLLGKMLLRMVLTPRSQNRRDLPWIRSSAGVLVFVSDVDDVPHWIEAGRCYERFALQATTLGLRNCFINQPVEVAAIRHSFASWLGVGLKRPDLVVRFGHGPEMPRSLRRPLAEVLSGLSPAAVRRSEPA